MLSASIRSKIDSLWGKFWSGGIANPLTAIEQISYLLFMRRLDVCDAKREEDAKWQEQSYTSNNGVKSWVFPFVSSANKNRSYINFLK